MALQLVWLKEAAFGEGRQLIFVGEGVCVAPHLLMSLWMFLGWYSLVALPSGSRRKEGSHIKGGPSDCLSVGLQS